MRTILIRNRETVVGSPIASRYGARTSSSLLCRPYADISGTAVFEGSLSGYCALGIFRGDGLRLSAGCSGFGNRSSADRLYLQNLEGTSFPEPLKWHSIPAWLRFTVRCTASSLLPCSSIVIIHQCHIFVPRARPALDTAFEYPTFHPGVVLLLDIICKPSCCAATATH